MDMPTEIAQQRQEIGQTLADLTDKQWNTPSCCADWSVLEVAAHLSYGWHYSTANLNWQLAKKFGDLDKVSAHFLTELTSKGGPAIAAEFVANADYRFKPPALGFAAPLNDLIIHRRDMFLPLGIGYDTDHELIRLTLDKAVARGMFAMVNSRKSLKGLSFSATDIDWTHGSGPAISGPGLALAHAMWGRLQSLNELVGPGVETLRTRLSN